jgi:hypothetical protein
MPKPIIQPQSGPPSISDLTHATEYYQHKTDECRELFDTIADWRDLPNATLSFSVGNVSIASFGFDASDINFLGTFLALLAEHFQNKKYVAQSKIDAQQLPDTGSSMQDSGPVQPSL